MLDARSWPRDLFESENGSGARWAVIVGNVCQATIAGSALVLAACHVQAPVTGILDLPVSPHSASELLGVAFHDVQDLLEMRGRSPFGD